VLYFKAMYSCFFFLRVKILIGPYFTDDPIDDPTSDPIEDEASPVEVMTIENALALDVIKSSDINDTWSFFLLKCIAVPTAAMFSSLSLPLSMIAIEKRFFPDINISLEQKILQTLLPYSALVGFRTWLLWYRIGQRLDGKPDEAIEVSSDTQDSASMVVFAGMMANISGFTNGLLLAFLLLQKTNKLTACAAGLALGSLSYTTDLLTDVADAFRKYVETQQVQGKQIHPFFKQKIIKCVFQSHIEKLGVFLREVLPIITAIIRSQATVQVTRRLFENEMSETKLRVLHLFLGVIVYESSAYFAKFDVIQLHDNLKACGLVNFDLENTLVNAQSKPVRFVGKIVNGQLLIDTCQRLGLSLKNSVDAAYLFAAVGFIAVIFTAFQTYVSSTNSQAVQDDKEGLLMDYYLGEKAALDIAPSALLGTISSAVILGAVGLFSQTGTLKQYAKSRSTQDRANQVLPSQETDVEGQIDLRVR
jgi:hypothetical protein